METTGTTNIFSGEPKEPQSDTDLIIEYFKNDRTSFGHSMSCRFFTCPFQIDESDIIIIFQHSQDTPSPPTPPCLVSPCHKDHQGTY